MPQLLPAAVRLPGVPFAAEICAVVKPEAMGLCEGHPIQCCLFRNFLFVLAVAYGFWVFGLAAGTIGLGLEM